MRKKQTIPRQQKIRERGRERDGEEERKERGDDTWLVPSHSMGSIVNTCPGAMMPWFREFL